MHNWVVQTGDINQKHGGLLHRQQQMNWPKTLIIPHLKKFAGTIQIPAVDVGPDRIRKRQLCKLTAADSQLSAKQSLNDVQCIVGNVVCFGVHRQDIPYKADTVTDISVFSEGEKDEERKKERRYTA